MHFVPTEKIEHALHPHFPDLELFKSTKSLEESKLYQELKPKILEVLNSYELINVQPEPAAEPYYRAVAWNIERGICFDEIVDLLKNHPVLSQGDVLLITEADLGMARSRNRNVAKELAEALSMNYFFVPSYLNLAKGSGTERDFEGENELGVHGNAILSRYPIREPRVVSLPNAHDKMSGSEKRLGNQRALIATIDLPGTPLRVGCAHLDVRSTQKHRRMQLSRVVEALVEEGDHAALIGGDWNTSTYDAHSAISAILGFWIRVAMGPGNMIRNHYPYPEKYFEKKLFQMLEKNGFDYKKCNDLGAATNHYSVENIKQTKNLGDWVPSWCFRFLEWSLRNHGGKCSLKLDWFAQKKLNILKAGEKQGPRKGPSRAPNVVGDIMRNGVPASDHDAVVVDFRF